MNIGLKNRFRPKWTFETRIPYAVEQVKKILFDIREGSFKGDELPVILWNQGDSVIKSEKGQWTVYFDQGHKAFLFIDKPAHTIALQGQWWYRGVYDLIEEAGESTTVKLRIYNIAPAFQWFASLMIIRQKQAHQMAFQDFIQQLEARIVKYVKS